MLRAATSHGRSCCATQQPVREFTFCIEPIREGRQTHCVHEIPQKQCSNSDFRSLSDPKAAKTEMLAEKEPNQVCPSAPL